MRVSLKASHYGFDVGVSVRDDEIDEVEVGT